jgi:hypothetical protein
MRTTLTLEADVAERVRREQRRTGRPFKAVVNEALRLGLGLKDKGSERLPRYQVRPHRCGAFRPGIDPLRLNQLYDEIEAGALGSTTLHDRGGRER